MNVRSHLLAAAATAVALPLTAPAVAAAWIPSEPYSYAPYGHCVGIEHDGGRPGGACFQPDGEILRADDFSYDGKFVRAELSWPDLNTPQRHTATVQDPNGGDAGGGTVNLEIKEGLKVKLRVCWQGQGCSDWYYYRA